MSDSNSSSKIKVKGISMSNKSYVVSYVAYKRNSEADQIFTTMGFIGVSASSAVAAWGIAWDTLDAEVMNEEEELQDFQMKDVKEDSFNYAGL